ncbi:outer membrane beta-barrel protein [Flavobacteriaceae bacterium R38]|nr:outer membrane beta-barrel protein [Flavobacteriaceae bacterium R38]
MKKQILIIITSILSFSSYAQIKFENGYFIDNSGKKTNCLIKNIDWENNPTKFEYKLSEDSQSVIGTIRTIKEFGIINKSKYERFNVEVDRTSNRVEDLTLNKNPEFKEETLFLKFLIQGEANLYLHKANGILRFFYNINNEEVKQLIHKKYLSPDNKIGVNNEFRKQLWNDLKYTGITPNEIRKINYNSNDLISYFIKYNSAMNSEYVDFKKKGAKEKSFINFKIKTGLDFSSLSIDQPRPFGSFTIADFGQQLSFRIGAELELILPFNKNKWAIFIESNYRNYNGSDERRRSDAFDLSDEQIIDVDYSVIEFPIGVRHYFFLNDYSKLFINASVALDFPINSTIDFENTNFSINPTTKLDVGLGVGYNYRNKFSLEFRYNPGTSIEDSDSFITDYSSASIILGYKIF